MDKTTLKKKRAIGRLLARYVKRRTKLSPEALATLIHAIEHIDNRRI